MQIYVGTDIEDISRFEDKSERFYERIYTPAEIEYCSSKKHSAKHYAARFCAKEAVIKALGDMGLKVDEMKHIEIYNINTGCPKVRLLSDDNALNTLSLSLSMSHSKRYATATVIISRSTTQDA